MSANRDTFVLQYQAAGGQLPGLPGMGAVAEEGEDDDDGELLLHWNGVL